LNPTSRAQRAVRARLVPVQIPASPYPRAVSGAGVSVRVDLSGSHVERSRRRPPGAEAGARPQNASIRRLLATTPIGFLSFRCNAPKVEPWRH